MVAFEIDRFPTARPSTSIDGTRPVEATPPNWKGTRCRLESVVDSRLRPSSFKAGDSTRLLKACAASNVYLDNSQIAMAYNA